MQGLRRPIATLAALLWIPAASAQASTIEVTTTADEFGTGPACSLREAVTSANQDSAFGGCATAGSDDDVILLAPGSYARDPAPDLEENLNVNGDLDVLEPVEIRPRPGAGRPSISAAGQARVFDLHAGQVELSGVRLGEGRLRAGDDPGGGAIRVRGPAALDLRRSVLANNATGLPGGSGGAIDNEGSLRLFDVTFRGNRAGDGGAISQRGQLFAMRVTLAANQAVSGDGGAVLTADGGHSILLNTTVSDNSAAGSGGGLALATGAMTIDNATVAFNDADLDADGSGMGGGLSGPVRFFNSIVAANVDHNPLTPKHDCDGASSLGFNLILFPSGCLPSPVPTDRLGTLPRLGPLGRHGGFAPTHVARLGSHAIGRGSPAEPGRRPMATGACLRRDQRGVRRPQGNRCDIGAVERRLSGPS